jgi:membrane fusion protein (multidrug efflux system)
VEKIHFSKGSYVPEGAVIAEMSDEMLIRHKLNGSDSQGFERISRLKEKESVSVMDYDHMKASSTHRKPK